METVEHHLSEIRKSRHMDSIGVSKHFQAIARIGTREAVRALIDVGLTHRNYEARDAATDLAQQLAAKKEWVVDELIKRGLRNKDKRKWHHAKLKYGSIRALAVPGNERALPALEKELDSPETDRIKYRHLHLFATIASIGGSKALEILVQRGLKHRKGSVASDAVLTISKIGGKKAIEALIEHGLGHNNGDVVHYTVNELKELIGEKAMGAMEERFVRRLPQEKGRDRLKAIRVLGAMGTRKAIKAILEHGLRSSDKRTALQSALEVEHAMEPEADRGDVFDDEDVKTIIEHGVNSKNPQMVATSMHLLDLTKSKSRQAVPAVIEHGLTHSKPWVVRISAEVLGRIGDERALVPLMRLADHKDKDVRDAVKEAIRSIQGAKRA